MKSIENLGDLIYCFPETAIKAKALQKKIFNNFLFFVLFFITTLSPTKAQSLDVNITRKEITISRITDSPSIDGDLDDAAWQNTSVARNFVGRKPNNHN